MAEELLRCCLRLFIGPHLSAPHSICHFHYMLVLPPYAPICLVFLRPFSSLLYHPTCIKSLHLCPLQHCPDAVVIIQIVNQPALLCCYVATCCDLIACKNKLTATPTSPPSTRSILHHHAPSWNDAKEEGGIHRPTPTRMEHPR